MAKTAAEKAAAAKKNGKNPASAANSTGGKAPKKDLATKAARQAYTKQPVKNNGGGAVNKDGTPRRAHKFRPGSKLNYPVSLFSNTDYIQSCCPEADQEVPVVNGAPDPQSAICSSGQGDHGRPFF